MGFRYLVLGAGVGKAIAWWLGRQNDTEKVVVADREMSRAVGATIAAGLPGRPDLCVPLVLNVQNKEKLGQALRGIDVVISALPAHLNPALAEFVTGQGVDFCDLGGVVSLTRDMLELDATANRRGRVIVTDCGLMPGLGNVILGYLLAKMSSLAPLSALIKVGALPEWPEPPANHQSCYSVQGQEHMCYDPAPIIKNGSVREIPPFSRRYYYPIPELEKICPRFPCLEAFPSSGAGLAAYHLVEKGITEFMELTLRWPGYIDFVSKLPRRWFAEATAKLPRTDKNHADVVYMQVSLAETRPPNRHFSCRLLDRYDHTFGLSATERTTGFAAAALARRIAHGAVTRAGAYAQEAALGRHETAAYLEELARWLDLKWYEE